MDLVGRMGSALRRHGTGIFRVATTKLFGRVARIDTLLVFSLKASSQQAGNHGQDCPVSVCRIVPDDESLLSRLCEQYPEKGFHERVLSPGRSCYVALMGEEVCGYGWTTRNEWEIEEVDWRYQIGPHEFVIYDCFVSPLRRGSGIYPAMLAKILRDHGSHPEWPGTALIGVTSVNRPSIKGIVKAGFVLTGSITCVRFLHFRKWWHTRSINPYAGDLPIPGQSC